MQELFSIFPEIRTEGGKIDFERLKLVLGEAVDVGKERFVKLPSWFEIDTPVGKYNPDWAILRQDGQAFYLVRETKGTMDFLKLRTTEADKVRCGQRHFELLGVPFAVVTSADQV
jgi:restriction endonuclease